VADSSGEAYVLGVGGEDMISFSRKLIDNADNDSALNDYNLARAMRMCDL